MLFAWTRRDTYLFISSFCRPAPRRCFTTHISQPCPTNPSSVLRIPLRKSPANLGIATTRGTRITNQDRTQAGVLKDGRFYFALFDGHSEEDCAEFLSSRLHEVVEESLAGQESAEDGGGGQLEVSPSQEPELVKTLEEFKKEVGGYWRRVRPDRMAFGRDSPSERALGKAFLKTDLEFLKRGGRGGSTASMALIRSRNRMPFWTPSANVELLTGHVGDSRIILCETRTGRAVPLSLTHHPATPSESRRLRRFSTSFMADSFGEARFNGLGMTRAFGDLHQKRVGVSAEADVRVWEGHGDEASFIVLCSDGVSGRLEDQEIVDMVKLSRTPGEAARNIVATVDDGGDRDQADNATVMVIKLGGWDRRLEGGNGAEGTRSLREWRAKEIMEVWRRQ